MLMSLFSVAANAAEEGAIEEIVVTGSLIRRDSFDMTSPIDVMDEVTLQEQGTPNLGEVLRNSTYNQGVESVGNILAANPQLVGNIGPNFRGLGERATLTLLDGRRTSSGNLANMYPQIMIERTESLTDGGATLYGTDAVGGVFNIIPKKNVNGVELMISSNQADGGWGENAFAALAGHDGDRGRFVAAFEYRDKDRLEFFDRKQYSLGAASYSSNPWPGNFIVPNRDASGAIASTTIRPDPGCGLNNDASGPGDSLFNPGTDVKEAGRLASRQGQVRLGRCRWEFGESFDYIDQIDTYTAAINYEYEFSDVFRISGEVMYNRSVVDTRGSPSNPGGRIPELGAVPGDNPGNPYRAFYDVDENGFYDPGEGDLLLYAQDANGDGVPDRDQGVDADGNGLDDVIVCGFAQASPGCGPNGGLDFAEDVFINPGTFRPVGYPYFGPSRLNKDATSNGAGEQDSDNFRIVTQLDYDIGESWSGWTSLVYDEYTYTGGGRGESLSALNAGLQGTLLIRDSVNDSSRPGWFNPFTTQNFLCENRDCSGGNRADPAVDGDIVNSVEVWDQVAIEEPTVAKTTTTIVEQVFTGDLFQMGGRGVGSAIGLNWRDDKWDVDTGPTSNALDLWIGIGGQDYKVERQTTALFAEINFPILNNWDVDISARNEWVEDDSPENLDNFNWRIGTRWEPFQALALRASFNTAFIAPSLAQLYAPSSLQGLSQITDPWLGKSDFAPRTTGGTETLRPEEADIYNLGFSLDLLDSSLRIDFDYKYFDFKDRIIRPAAQEVLNEEVARATAAGFGINPAGLQDWLDSGLADPGIIRVGDQNAIQVVTTDQLNAQSMKWRGFDMNINYFLPWDDWGNWDIGLAATYVEKYNYTSFSGDLVKGSGNRNNNVAAVPPTPRWKANLRLGWGMGNHRVTLYGRYIDGINRVREGDPFASTNSAFVQDVFFPSLGVTNTIVEEMASYTTWDLQYSLTLPGLILGGDTNIQVGGINIFDKEATPLLTLGGLETSLYDPRGATWYIRLRQTL
jgi:outer membrane receptor protein involved in Fe transport